MATLAFARRGGKDDLQQSRFAGAVRADEAEAVAARHDQVEVADQRAISEGLGHPGEFAD
jgi:hypothetical protein